MIQAKAKEVVNFQGLNDELIGRLIIEDAGTVWFVDYDKENPQAEQVISWAEVEDAYFIQTVEAFYTL